MTEIKRDLRADLAIINAATCGPWSIDGDNNVDGPDTGYGELRVATLEGTARREQSDNATFIAEARTAWPHAIERAINAEAIAEMWRNEAAIQAQQYLDAEEENARLRAGIAVAMTYSGGIIVEMLRKLLTEVPADE
jgi:hypothetical protein